MKKIIQIHIPRTAGRSLAKGLGRAGHGQDMKHKIRTKYSDGVVFVSTIREPFDRFESLFYNHKAVHKDITFEEFLVECKKSDLHGPQIRWLRNSDGVIDVTLLRYETLDTDWLGFCKKYGLKHTDLPHIGEIKRAEFLWTPDAITMVRKYYKEDFDLYETY